MIKLMIITWHSLPNHGGMLQMYGLSKVLSKLGCETEFLIHPINMDYKFLSSGPQKSRFQKVFSLNNWRIKLNQIKGKSYNDEKLNLMLSFQSQSFNTRTEIGNDINACCVGSDEVFSLVNTFTPAFFGEGVDCPVFSYAGSFGQTTKEIIDRRGLKDRLSADLSKFKSISVRDYNSKELVEYLDNEASVHIDPVLLYGFKEELSVREKKQNKRIIIYSYDRNMNTDSEIHTIMNLSKTHGNLPVVSAGFYHMWCDDCIQVDPIQLIQVFNNSKYIITDTFHGAVISIITHSRFVVKVRNSLNSNKLISLLKMLGLEDRIAYDDQDFVRILEKEIDYEKVEATLNKYRDDSISYLATVLEEIEHSGYLQH